MEKKTHILTMGLFCQLSVFYKMVAFNIQIIPIHILLKYFRCKRGSCIHISVTEMYFYTFNVVLSSDYFIIFYYWIIEVV